jgi:hypothetical protein
MAQKPEKKRSQTPNWHTKPLAEVIFFIRSFYLLKRAGGALSPAKTGGKLKDDKS